MNELQAQDQQQYGAGRLHPAGAARPTGACGSWPTRHARLPRLALGRVAVPARALESKRWFLLARRRGDPAPVPRGARRLGAHRGRAPAVDRVGPAEDRRRQLAERRRRATIALQPRRLRRPLRRAPRRRLRPHAPLRAPRPARGRRRGRRVRAPGGRLLMDLETFWFCLIAVLWAGYFVLEGFDFGVGHAAAVRPAPDEERARHAARTIGPVWDGNEVWLVVAGGATFAAFPAWYATMFSGFYLALLLMLVFLIVRVVSFEWREKSETPRWRSTWAWANTIGSFGAPLLWGIGLVDLAARRARSTRDGDFAGDFGDLFSPYTVFAGIAVVRCSRSTARCSSRCARPATCASGRGRRAHGSRSRRRSLGGAFLVWTVVVAIDRNDKDVFPPALPAASAIAALALAVAFVFTAAQRPRVRDDRARRRSSLVATLFIEPLPARDGLEHRLREQPDGRRRGLVALHAEVMTRRRADPRPLVLLYQGWTYYVFRAPARRGTTEPSPIAVDAEPLRSPTPGYSPLMRLLDPRLLQRARACARCSSLDAALGVARGAARARAGGAARARRGARVRRRVARRRSRRRCSSSSPSSRRGRRAAWGFEVAGRRAAADVLSQLRLDLVERGFDDAAGGARRRAERRGRDGRRARASTRSRRRSRATCRRSCSPRSSRSRCSCCVASIDPLAAGVMLLTLPLVPVFMWLVGRYTERRARERWQALALLSTHFLDVVRGLPTLRAFNRGAGAGGAHRRGQRRVPPGDDGDAARRVPLRRGARARRDARRSRSSR